MRCEGEGERLREIANRLVPGLEQHSHPERLPPVDRHDFRRMLPHPKQWLQVRWWSWRLEGILGEGELAIWRAWRQEWWP